MGLLTALPSAADDRIILTIGDISDRTSSRMDGEGFYFFPQKIGYNCVGYSNSAYNRGYIVRWDYYKELGYPPINNEEDYLNVLLQMHANHPYTEEGYPTYLYGATNFKGYATAFRSELSLDYWAAYKYQNNIFTNEIFDGYTDADNSTI